MDTEPDKELIFMATKEFLRKLRMKHHLGEFSKKHVAHASPKRIKRASVRHRRRARQVFSMVRHHKVHHSSKGGGIMALARMAYSAGMTGVGIAAVANKLTNGTEVVPFQAELAAFAGSAITGKTVKNALIKGGIGAAAVAGVKYIPGLLQKTSGSTAGANGPNMN
jgi:hypothetical protein